MSSESVPPLVLPQSVEVAQTESQEEGLIARRLGQTQRHVKWTDVTASVLALVVGVLGYLLAAALVDHWLVTGGLGFWGRFAMWAVLVVAVVVHFVCRVWPPLVHRINPIFAAATIEKSEPSLKNSLINFLLLRGRRQEVSPVVFQAIERRAASDLSRVQVDSEVDRGYIIRLGYVSVALVAIFVVYLIASPKNPLRSAIRVLWPWADVAAPTRVWIRDVQPGNAVAFHGESVSISADIRGVQESEPVSMIYSTLDGQYIDQVVPLSRPAGEDRYQCRFPADKLGLQQSCVYHLAAGDARTRRFRIEVRTAPTISVERIDYHYLPYTEIPDRSVEGREDVEALEGTEVTIYATTNADIRPNSAEIDLGCDGRNVRKMTVQEDRKAEGRFTLALKPADLSKPDEPRKPEYDGYQLRFADSQGQEDRSPVRHEIHVIRDLPPTIWFVEPDAADATVAVNGRLPIRLAARDPDFALRRVTLWAKPDKEPKEKAKPLAPMLDRPRDKKPWTGEFQETFILEPAKLGWKAGDVVQVWGEAEDNKEPQANHSETKTPVRIEIAPPDSAQTPPKDADSKQEDAAEDSKTGQRDGKSPTRANRGESERDKTGKDSSKDEERSQPPAADEGTEQRNAEQDKAEQADQAARQPGAQQQENRQESKERGEGASDASSAGAESGAESGDKSDAAQSQESGESSSGKSQDGQAQDKNKQDGAGQEGEQSGGEGKGDSSSKQGNERIDPETDPGGAMQQILKDRQEQQEQETKQGEQPQQGQQQDGKQQDGQQPSEGQTPQAGEQPSDRDAKTDKPSEEQKSAEDRKPPEEQGASTGDRPSQKEQPSDQQRPSEGQESSDNRSDKQPQGGEQANKKSSDQQKTSPDQPQDKQAGSPQKGQQQGGQEGEEGGKADEQGNQQGAEAGGKQQGKGSSDADQKAGSESSDAGGSKKGGASPKSSADQAGDQQTDDQGGESDKGDQGKSSGKDAEKGEKGSGSRKATDSPKESEEAEAKEAGDKDAEAKNVGDKNIGDKDIAEAAAKEQGKKSQDSAKTKSRPSKETSSDEVKPPTTSELSSPDAPQKKGDASDKATPMSGDASDKTPPKARDTAASQDEERLDAAARQSSAKDSQTTAKRKPSDAAQDGKTHSATEEGLTDDAAAKSDAADDAKATADSHGDQTAEGGEESKGEGAERQASKATGKSGKEPGDSEEKEPNNGSSDGSSPAGGGKEGKGQDQGKSGNQSSRQSKQDGAGRGSAGGAAGEQPGGEAEGPIETPADPANLAYAEKQTELALEHLRDQLAKEKHGLLDRLGWTKEDAKQFLDRWEGMRREAKQQGPKGEEARKRLNETLQSLGLRPRGTTIGRGAMPADQQQNLRDAGRFAAPPEWAEQYRDYTRGIADPKQSKGIRERP